MPLTTDDTLSRSRKSLSGYDVHTFLPNVTVPGVLTSPLPKIGLALRESECSRSFAISKQINNFDNSFSSRRR